jgi:hypothetical protein
MGTWSYVKAQDRYLTHTGGSIGTVDLQGTWVRTDAPDRGIAQAVVQVADGGLCVQVFESDGSATVDWGAASIDAVYASSPEALAGVGFTTRYDLTSRVVELHANMSKGLLIIAALTTFRQRTGQRAEFAREFFRKVEAQRPCARRGYRSEVSSRPGALPGESLSPMPFLGTWRNTNSKTAGLSEVSFAREGESLVLHALGAGDGALIDWGPTRARVFASHDAATEPVKIQAAYDFGFMEFLMHAWVKQGVLVIAHFNRFKDQSRRSNYFDREFFYRDDPGANAMP